MRNLHAIVLAAGEGTRMKSETPKVLHPICGRPMIAYALHLAAAVGVKQPIVILGGGAEETKPHLPKEARVVLQPKRQGTGDAVLMAKKALGTTGDVLILYGDTPLLRRTTIQKLVETHFRSNASCTLLTAHLADPSGYGRIVRNEQGHIAGIVEEAEANAAQRAIREINVGPILCKVPALLAALAELTPSATKKEFYLTQAVALMAKQEGAKLSSTHVEEAFEALGINSRAELARAIGVIRQRLIDLHLHNGVTIEDPSSTFIEYGVTIGADTRIRPYTVIESDVAIGKRCTIGPFVHLRSGVTVGDESRVGNFAEMVRTKIGPRVRVGHVSYLGDAVVEEGTNIGAGTITANFDGTQKHQTHIGKGAFIGSDTVLIAPVKVGAGAVTGAGSVVTKAHDIPPKGVVAGVPARAMQVKDDAVQRNGSASGRSRRGKAAAARKPAGRTARTRPAKRARGTTARRKAVRTRPAKRVVRRTPARRARPMARRARPVKRARRAARR